jgi:hypothetical protein
MIYMPWADTPSVIEAMAVIELWRKRHWTGSSISVFEAAEWTMLVSQHI